MPRVLVIVLEGAQTLDVCGPAEVFAAAGRELGRQHYRCEFASSEGGSRTLSCGLSVQTVDLRTVKPKRDDLVVVSGGGEAVIARALADRELLGWLRRAAGTVHRMTSVCSGAFVLAAAGLLDGKRVTTHWAACDRLAQEFPAVEVDRNAIFVVCGSTWTSAGVTTGIDMALALVEEQLGRTLADDVAARLVLYMRRPGYQSQWSDALVAQRSGDPLGPAIAWARGHLDRADPDALARHAGMSPRTFHRRCLEHLQTTPAKLIDKLRVERARDLLSKGTLPTKVVAARSGFSSPARMKRAFERELGLGPRAYRLLHPS